MVFAQGAPSSLCVLRQKLNGNQESLAQSFEGVNLPEDSLIIYEELEAAFIQVLKEQNLSWFGKLGATGSRDDSLPVLNTTMKPYREMLRSSSISVFDFRIYLFARQGILLGKLGRITEVAKRGQWFVASLANRLRENEVCLHSSCLHCEYLHCYRPILRNILSNHGLIPPAWTLSPNVISGRDLNVQTMITLA